MSELSAPAPLTCGRCASRVEPGDLRCPVCALALPVDREAPLVARAEILRCDGCGAAVRYDAQAQAPRCAFCTSVMHVERPTDPPEEAEWRVPFAVQPATAKSALGRWLAKKSWFAPGDLAKASTLDSIRALYWPAWIFDARASVSWTAESNHGADKAAFAPHAGHTSMSFHRILVSASRGLTSAEARDLSGWFDLSRAEAAGLAPRGFVEERFDVQRSAARQRVLEAVERTAAERLKAETIPGARVRKVKVSALLEGLTTHRFLLPTYVLAYRYGGKVYRALVHGQDAEVIVGRRPISPWRVAAAVLALLVGGAALLGLSWLRANR